MLAEKYIKSGVSVKYSVCTMEELGDQRVQVVFA